jgi:hypothetical protein
VLECGGSDVAPAGPYHVAVSGGAARSTLLFGDREVGITQVTTMARLERRLSPRVQVGAGAGALLGGGLTVAGVEHDFSTGLQASAGASALALPETARAPFLLVGLGLSYGHARTSVAGADDAPYDALDLRLTLAAGKTLGPVTFYAAARGFIGPVWWRIDGASARGTDKFHREIGLGVAWRLPGRFDLSVEALGLGEETVSAGVGWTF